MFEPGTKVKIQNVPRDSIYVSHNGRIGVIEKYVQGMRNNFVIGNKNYYKVILGKERLSYLFYENEVVRTEGLCSFSGIR